jgi:hypothetical protein
MLSVSLTLPGEELFDSSAPYNASGRSREHSNRAHLPFLGGLRRSIRRRLPSVEMIDERIRDGACPVVWQPGPSHDLLGKCPIALTCFPSGQNANAERMRVFVRNNVPRWPRSSGRRCCWAISLDPSAKMRVASRARQAGGGNQRFVRPPRSVVGGRRSRRPKVAPSAVEFVTFRGRPHAWMDIAGCRRHRHSAVCPPPSSNWDYSSTMNPPRSGADSPGRG